MSKFALFSKHNIEPAVQIVHETRPIPKIKTHKAVLTVWEALRAFDLHNARGKSLRLRAYPNGVSDYGVSSISVFESGIIVLKKSTQYEPSITTKEFISVMEQVEPSYIIGYIEEFTKNYINLAASVLVDPSFFNGRVSIIFSDIIDRSIAHNNV